MSELPNYVLIEDNNVEIEMLSSYSGLLGKNYLFTEHLSYSDIGNGLIFTTGGYSFSLIWSKNSIFLFDLHSRDINGCFTDQGSSVALSFKTLIDVDQYIKTEYLKHLSNFHETQYELQYVRVTSSSVSEILDTIKKHRNRIQCDNRICEKRAEMFGTPEHDQINHRKREKYAQIVGTLEHDQINHCKREKYAQIVGTLEHDQIKHCKRQKRAEILGTPEHEEIKSKMSTRYYNYITSKTSAQRISKFTELITEGPYYICVVCNRCHYHRSVLLFNHEKYVINIDNFYHEVTSFDCKIYICRTCHKKMKKSEIPAQAVWNKLDIFLLPADLANLNRLERVIISRRILF